MLEKLRVRNFQAHRVMDLDLNHPVVTLTGPSDSGKSAVLRALRWVCLNEPTGDVFITWGEKTCSVGLQVDGVKITRKKGSENSYRLGGKKFAAFGTSVPPEIQDLLKVDHLNFQKQLDGPFLLSLTPGECARELNRVIDLSEIDEALSEAASLVKKAKLEVEITQKRAEQWRNQCDRTVWVEDFSRRLAGSVEVASSFAIIRDSVTSLAALLAELGAVEEVSRESTTAATAFAATASLAGELLAIETEIDALAALLGEIKALDWVVPPPSLGELTALYDRHERVSAEAASLEQLLGEISCLETETAESARRRGEIRTEIEALTGGLCPLCGSETTPS